MEIKIYFKYNCFSLDFRKGVAYVRTELGAQI